MSVELVELRNAFEGGALIRLAKHHTDEDLAVLQASVDELRAAVGRDIGVQELARMTSDFHRLVCERSGNEMFALMIHSFSPMSAILWENCAAYWGAEGFVEQDEHLIGLIRRGEGHEAQKYIEDIFDEFLAAFSADPHIVDRR